MYRLGGVWRETYDTQPEYRGVLHKYGFFVFLIAGVALVVSARAGRATWAAGAYAGSLAALLGVSALYHRIDWPDRVRRWMRRLDHSLIFVLIAGTLTPFAMLVLDPSQSEFVLVTTWSTVAVGVCAKLLWISAPDWVSSLMYVGASWSAVLLFPQLADAIGVFPSLLMLAGGIVYTVGAIIYALNRPNPWPGVFGFHEIFHALVLLASAIHFTVIAFYVVT